MRTPSALFHEENDYGHDGHNDEHNLKRAPSSIGSHNGLELVVSLADNISQPALGSKVYLQMRRCYVNKPQQDLQWMEAGRY